MLGEREMWCKGRGRCGVRGEDGVVWIWKGMEDAESRALSWYVQVHMNALATPQLSACTDVWFVCTVCGGVGGLQPLMCIPVFLGCPTDPVDHSHMS